MPDTPAPQPAPPGDEKPRRRNHAQNQLVAACIVDSATFLAAAKGDPEIRPLIEARGCDSAEFAEGEALVAALGRAYADRAAGMGEEGHAVDESQTKTAAARDTYAQFREIARANFPEPADRAALGLAGEVPEGFDAFVALAGAGYANGQKAPHAAKLTKRGYGPAVLAGMLADLDSLATGPEAAQNQAAGDAIGDTGERDEAYAELKAFMQQFKGTIRGALRGKPHLLAKLKL